MRLVDPAGLLMLGAPGAAPSGRSAVPPPRGRRAGGCLLRPLSAASPAGADTSSPRGASEARGREEKKKKKIKEKKRKPRRNARAERRKIILKKRNEPKKELSPRAEALGTPGGCGGGGALPAGLGAEAQ